MNGGTGVGAGEAGGVAQAVAGVERDQAARVSDLGEVFAAVVVEPGGPESRAVLQQAQALDAASNAVVDLVHAGRLDEAEQAARELLHRYPEVHDGYDRLGMVHEARGQFRQAAHCYRKVIELTRARPAHYDTALVESFLELIAKLEARAAALERAVNDDRPG